MTPPTGPREPYEKPRVSRRRRSQGEITLSRHIAWEGLPEPELEYHWARDEGRRFRFDFAWPNRLLAVEVDGGKFMIRRSRKQRGRMVVVGAHNRREDLERQNLAARLGWTVLRYTPDMVAKGEAIRELKAMLLRPVLDDAPGVLSEDPGPGSSGG